MYKELLALTEKVEAIHGMPAIVCNIFFNTATSYGKKILDAEAIRGGADYIETESGLLEFLKAAGVAPADFKKDLKEAEEEINN
jgi:hypothetical protein